MASKRKQDPLTTEQFVAKAKELRDAAKAAEEEFLGFLMLGEQMTHIWQGTGLTYVQFIKQTDLCDPARFLAWKATKSNPMVSDDLIKKAGVEAAVASGKLRDPKAQVNVMQRAAKFAETNGVQPSAQTARTYAKEEHAKTIGAESVIKVPRGGGAKSYSTLSDENDRLRSENETLRQQNTALRAEVKTLKAQIKANATATAKPANTNAKKKAA